MSAISPAASLLAELAAPENRELLDRLLRPRDDTRPPPPVSQRMLRLYEMLEQLQAAKQQLRRLFIDSAEAGIRGEPGERTLVVSTHWIRSFSYDELVRLLGEPTAERLKSMLIPTLRTTVRVRPSGDGLPGSPIPRRRSAGAVPRVRDGFDPDPDETGVGLSVRPHLRAEPPQDWTSCVHSAALDVDDDL